MSSAEATRLNPVPVGSEDLDSGKHPEQIGCLVAKMQTMYLDGKRQYRENTVESDNDMADTESNSSDEETVLYPKKEGSPMLKEEAFNVAAWHKSTRELVTSMRKTHNVVPIFDIGNDKPAFVGRIVPTRSRSVIPNLPSNYSRRTSPYDRIYAPKVDINSLLDDLRPFVNPVRPEYGAEVFNYASNLKMPLSIITHETFLLGP
ncbi:hypothetical protein RSAG8_12100, partial [Rhizoctonia solani AG-8 WAC10335]